MKKEIVNHCAELFGVSGRDLLGSSRLRHIVHARFALYAALRQRGWSFPQIGIFFDRHHSSIIHGVRVAEYLMEHNRSYEEKVEALAVWKPKSVRVGESTHG